MIRIRLGELRRLAGELGPDDLLIAVAAGARADQELLPAGIAGPGYDGNLTSASTRTDGVVLTTDIAPTVLEHLGTGGSTYGSRAARLRRRFWRTPTRNSPA